jgi:hypothetical protein
MKRLVVALALISGCADIDEKPVTWQIDEPYGEATTSDPSVDPVVTTPIDEPVVYIPTLIVPTGDCMFPSVALTGLPAAVPGQDAAVVENFDALGCPTELWVNNYDAGVLSLTAYMPWNPPPAYMIYRPWVETYESVGNTNTTERRDSHDGPLFSRVQTQHDSGGEVLVRKYWGNEWASESVAGSEYREERFHPVSHVQTLTEYKTDGVTHWRSRTEVNAAGEPLRTFVFQSDEEQMTHEWTYANGRLASLSYSEGNMRAESTYVWHADSSHTLTTRNITQGWIDVYDYDALGRLTRHTQDENRDGRIEYLETKAYDDLGHVISEVNGYEFVNGVATRGTDIERAYDGDRLLWETIIWKGFNMQLTPSNTLSVTRTDFTYSGAGEAHERNKLLHYPDGRVMREIARFDALGQETLMTQDTGDDGSIEWKVERLYDGPRQLAETITSDTQHWQQEWLYDAQDRLVLWVRDYDGDGDADEGTRYRYDVDGLAAYNALTPHTP